MDDVTVGIDIGTTSVKAVAADADGNVVTRTRIAHRVVSPDAGRFEHDPGEAWIDGVLSAWDHRRHACGRWASRGSEGFADEVLGDVPAGVRPLQR